MAMKMVIIQSYLSVAARSGVPLMLSIYGSQIWSTLDVIYLWDPSPELPRCYLSIAAGSGVPLMLSIYGIQIRSCPQCYLSIAAKSQVSLMLSIYNHQSRSRPRCYLCQSQPRVTLVLFKVDHNLN